MYAATVKDLDMFLIKAISPNPSPLVIVRRDSLLVGLNYIRILTKAQFFLPQSIDSFYWQPG